MRARGGTRLRTPETKEATNNSPRLQPFNTAASASARYAPASLVDTLLANNTRLPSTFHLPRLRPAFLTGSRHWWISRAVMAVVRLRPPSGPLPEKELAGRGWRRLVKLRPGERAAAAPGGAE
uniref:Uncharacterized protein n=1 Tax=Rangifer tarandus platyrhynchus TaxID=3082113 RepID=A0ACB0FJD0_RANTA|nr:unnamed protein product [Rangifer tarandus platyrhynchus]